MCLSTSTTWPECAMKRSSIPEGRGASSGTPLSDSATLVLVADLGFVLENATPTPRLLFCLLAFTTSEMSGESSASGVEID